MDVFKEMMMVMEGLRTAPRPDEANITGDHIGANVEALNILGLIEDRDQATETITAEFTTLSQAGRPGEAFVQIPRGVITLSDLIIASDSNTYSGDRKYPKTSVYDRLWTPGTSPGSYRADELDNLTLNGNGNFALHARLAVHNAANPKEPLLHFVGKPFDSKYAKRNEQTQLEAIDEAVSAYDAEGHEGFEMTPLNAKAVVMIALVRRVKGVPMPMEWGYMHDATIGRHKAQGNLFAGRIGSFGNQLILHGSDGYRFPSLRRGVGLSIGPKEDKITALN